MCQKCVDAAREFFPAIPKTEIGNWLMSCTCFPFGNGPEERAQIKELRDQTDDYRECYAIADQELTAEMAMRDGMN